MMSKHYKIKMKGNFANYWTAPFVFRNYAVHRAENLNGKKLLRLVDELFYFSVSYRSSFKKPNKDTTQELEIKMNTMKCSFGKHTNSTIPINIYTHGKY